MTPAPPEKLVVALERRGGAQARRFVDYVCRELWLRAREMALADGFSPVEAEEVARATAHAAVRGHSAAIRTVLRLRGLGHER